MTKTTYREFTIDNDVYCGVWFEHPDRFDVDHDGERFVGNGWGGHANTVADAKEQIDDIWYDNEPAYLELWQDIRDKREKAETNETQ